MLHGLSPLLPELPTKYSAAFSITPTVSFPQGQTAQIVQKHDTFLQVCHFGTLVIFRPETVQKIFHILFSEEAARTEPACLAIRKRARYERRIEMSFTEKAKVFGAKQVISYIDKDPDTNIPKILDWLENHDKSGSVTPQVQTIRRAIQDPDNNWNKLIKSLWTDIDDGVRKTLFENFAIHASLIGSKRQKECSKQYGCNVPWAILMDPTSACNLHCTGCWAAEYGNRLNMTLEELEQYNFGYYFEDEKGDRTYKDVTDLEGTGLQIATVDKLFAEFYESHPHLLFIVEIKNSGKMGYNACRILNETLNQYPE